MVAYIAQTTFESACAFIAKHTFSFYALDNIRQELEELISAVVRPHLGPFFTVPVGRELSIIFSIPVTCFVAEMFSIAVKEGIRAVIEVASSYFGFMRSKSLGLFMREQALFISGFITGFLAKSYFCSYAMPVVRQGCELVLKHAVRLSAVPFPFSTIIPYFAIMAVPYVTFIIGDIVWKVISDSTEELLDNVLDLAGI